MSQPPIQPDQNPYGHQEENPYEYKGPLPYIDYSKENPVSQTPRTGVPSAPAQQLSPAIQTASRPAVPAKVLGRFRVAFRVIFFIAALSILLGIVAVAFQVQSLLAQGFGVVTIIIGAIFLLLGFWVRRKSTVALGIAVTIYALDGILSLFTGNFLGVLVHIWFLFLMSRGFSAIREILAAEATQ